MKFLFFTIFISLNAIADLENAPTSFKHRGKKVVFVDFQYAHYDITYQANTGNAWVISKISFNMPEKGYPLFDSTSVPTMIKINNTQTSQNLIRTPGNASSVRMVNRQLVPGDYTLELKTDLKNGTIYKRKRAGWTEVSSGFFIRDLRDRMLLEKYLPTNYEFDRYKMDIEVKVKGTKRWHSLFANGNITKLAENHYRIAMPNWYTSSSVYFHLVPVNKFVRWYLTYNSIDGREIPVTIYSRYRFYNYYAQRKAWRVLKELEKDYGPYPHSKLIIYGTGIKGGMEHAGATETSIVSLGHELLHMYFAKCVHPINGNSGWLDEAIASWRDKGYKTRRTPFFKSVNLAAHSSYMRKTDKRSYKYGRSFMAYLDYQLKDAGHPGLKDFLRVFFKKRKYTSVSTEDFKSDLEEYASMSFGEDFNQYIYGGISTKKKNNLNDQEEENPHHPNRTQAEMDSII